MSEVIYGDNRCAYVSMANRSGGGLRFDPPLGGYGSWKTYPDVGPGTKAGDRFLNVPLPMTQKELQAQYEWAMERSDRAEWRPIRFEVPA